MDNSVGFIVEPKDKTVSYSTQCKNCVFLNNLKECELGRIVQFQIQNPDTEVTQFAYEDGAFPVIKDRICNTLRIQDAWPKGENLSLDEQKQLVKKEIEITVDMLIYIDDKCTLEHVKNITQDIENMTFIPKKVHYIINSLMKPSDVVKIARCSKLENLEWTVVRIQQVGISRSMERCLDHAIKDTNYRYYTVFRANSKIKPDFLEKINYHLNENLARFSALESNDYPNGIFVSTQLHKHSVIAGNLETLFQDSEGNQTKCNNVIEKIKFIAKEDNKSYMVQNIEDICE